MSEIWNDSGVYRTTSDSVFTWKLTEDMLVRILKEPKNAIIKQYQKLLAMDEVDLVFDEDALYAIAKKAKEKKVGAVSTSCHY